MRLSVVQFCPKLKQKEENTEKVIDYINKTDTDIIVFPELSTSGYFFLNRQESSEFAEPFNGPTANRIADMAVTQDKIIIYGFAESDGNRIFNSAAILFPDRSLNRVYRKTHLFYKEKLYFDPGDSGFFVIYDSRRDINIGAMICYDWRFPEAARSLALQGADLIVCPSNLVTDIWHKVMPARAIENKVYYAVANRTGKEVRQGEELLFKGQSAIHSYNGRLMTNAGFDDESVIVADINPKETRDKSFNPINDLFNDRRPELYVI